MHLRMVIDRHMSMALGVCVDKRRMSTSSASGERPTSRRRWRSPILTASRPGRSPCRATPLFRPENKSAVRIQFETLAHEGTSPCARRGAPRDRRRVQRCRVKIEHMTSFICPGPCLCAVSLSCKCNAHLPYVIFYVTLSVSSADSLCVGLRAPVGLVTLASLCAKRRLVVNLVHICLHMYTLNITE
jgi:hypothetical protein